MPPTTRTASSGCSCDLRFLSVNFPESEIMDTASLASGPYANGSQEHCEPGVKVKLTMMRIVVTIMMIIIIIVLVI